MSPVLRDTLRSTRSEMNYWSGVQEGLAMAPELAVVFFYKMYLLQEQIDILLYTLGTQ